MDIVYEALKKIPGMTDNEAHEVPSKLSKPDDFATKSDIEKMGRVIIMWICGFAVVYSGVLLAVMRLFM